MQEHIAIIGTGRIGSNLALALLRSGHHLVAVVDEDAECARRCAQACGGGVVAVAYESLPPGLSLIFVAVPDDRIEEAARRLASTEVVTQETIVCHLSGSLAADVLSPLRAQTMRLVACHPLQTFSSPLAGGEAFFDIYFCLQGDEGAWQRLKRVVQRLRGRAFVLAEEKKPLYHLACVLAANYFVGLAFLVQQILHRVDIESLQIMGPLWQTTLENILRQGPEQALTGPIVRGDVETVRRHLEEIKKEFPQLLKVYQDLGLCLLDLARKRSDKKAFATLEELLTNGI